MPVTDDKPTLDFGRANERGTERCESGVFSIALIREIEKAACTDTHKLPAAAASILILRTCSLKSSAHLRPRIVILTKIRKLEF